MTIPSLSVADGPLSAPPEPDIVLGTREQLLHLLAEAAEIEHTLMCSYLYAAFSLKRAGEAGVSPAQGAVLERWRKTIIAVAVEEMGHLVIVANLTVAVGGRPHFARPNFPISPDYFPACVAVRLTAFDAETLEHFIFLERPQGVEGQDGDSFEQQDYSRDQARIGLMPSAQDYATIGHLYEAIRANLVALERQLGGDMLFLGDAGAQVGRDVIDLEGVIPILDLEGATEAIDVVIEQGEGSSTEQEESHYRHFLAIRDELAEMTRNDPGFAPAWPVADSPVLRRPAEPNGTLFVDHPAATGLLDFACASYGLLLRRLVQCFGRTGANRAQEQKLLMSAAIDMMHVLGDASSLLARLPASTTEADVHAGMTFTMLRGMEPLLPGEPERRMLAERAADLARAARHVMPDAAGKLDKIGETLKTL
ncbi:ferritin-like domain-containing protein [Sphingomonas endolithica]|uniref:ferritin-like domain-containing protein n=1 Tax=Sphingomonas endolithica TaxID=2972485 RepID=UPI0021AE6385|nr:ferritin-like protein [Sphingomonas sp. ZFBP2030]